MFQDGTSLNMCNFVCTAAEQLHDQLSTPIGKFLLLLCYIIQGLFKLRETINLTEGLKYNLLCNIKITEGTKHEAVSDSWHNLIANHKTLGRLSKAQ